MTTRPRLPVRPLLDRETILLLPEVQEEIANRVSLGQDRKHAEDRVVELYMHYLLDREIVERVSRT